MKIFILILIFSACIQSCIIFDTGSEKSAFVIFNNTTHPVKIKALLNDTWGPSETIKAGKSSYLLVYDSHNKKEPPSFLHAILVSQNQYSLHLTRDELIKLKTKDKDGRAGWNLDITPLLLTRLECKE